MNKTISEQYFDGLIDNTIEMDPAAMSQVIKWMESIRENSNVNKEIEQKNKTINEIYMDNLIETSIGVDPVAMYQVLNKIDSLTQHPERDHAFSACIDEVASGIDNQLKEYLAKLSFAGSKIINSDIDIDYNTIIKALNRMEERLARIERNLAELC